MAGSWLARPLGRRGPGARRRRRRPARQRIRVQPERTGHVQWAAIRTAGPSLAELRQQLGPGRREGSKRSAPLLARHCGVRPDHGDPPPLARRYFATSGNLPIIVYRGNHGVDPDEPRQKVQGRRTLRSMARTTGSRFSKRSPRS